jgi:DNA-binding transcriptional regulator YbjK
VGEWPAGDRTGVEPEYELYLAALRRPALRRPALRPVAAEWCEDLAERLARRTDPLTARALVALVDGICLQVLPTGAPYDEEYARKVSARVIP